MAGESAGGNLAINVAIEARDRQATLPGHMLLVYPVAGNDMMSESYVENADAAPLSRAGMELRDAFATADEDAAPIGTPAAQHARTPADRGARQAFSAERRTLRGSSSFPGPVDNSGVNTLG